MSVRHRYSLGALTAALWLLVSAPTAGAQWATTYDQFYRQASHNWEFRRNFPAADRLFNAFDYGHAILYETLWRHPGAPPARLEEQEYDFITRRLLVKPPRVPLEESAIEVEYAKLAPEAKQMFDWAHILHRQVYDVWADERISPERKDAEVAALLAYYRSRRDLAFSIQPKDMELMEGQPYSLAFRRRYPKFNGLIWAYHWLQVGLYEPLVVARSAEERRVGVERTVARFRALLEEAPRHMPTIMPMTAAVAPEFARRYPEVAIIFDNLHSMHDVISDILADSTVPRNRKRAAILLAASRYRDDTTSIMTVAEWREMSNAMGITAMGGPAAGDSVLYAPMPAAGAPAHDAHAGHAMPPASAPLVNADSARHEHAVPGPWTAEQVEARLAAAGIAARARPYGGSHMFMSVPARSYQLADADELQVFLYDDAAARARDTDRLDTVRVAPPGMMIKWRAQPSLLVDGNLAAIIITNDQARRERIRGALLGSSSR